LVNATTAATPTVSFRAATASGAVIEPQKPVEPSARAAHTSAAIGRTTTTVRYVVTKPRERAVPALSLAWRDTRPAPRAGAEAVLASRRPSDGLLDLHHPAVAGREPDLVGVAPAADVLVVDPEDARPCGELPLHARLGRDRLVHRTEPVLGEQLLRGR